MRKKHKYLRKMIMTFINGLRSLETLKKATLKKKGSFNYVKKQFCEKKEEDKYQ